MNDKSKIKKGDQLSTDDDNFISPLEIKRITEAINKSDTEKFLLFTRLMRINSMLQNAIIIRKKSIV